MGSEKRQAQVQVYLFASQNTPPAFFRRSFVLAALAVSRDGLGTRPLSPALVRVCG